MIAAMFLAHLVGDFVLQWDALARWKSRAWRGVAAHGVLVWLVTWAIAALFDPGWWPWALLIGVTHTLIDMAPLWLAGRVPAFTRLVADQAAHSLVILVALAASGYLPASDITYRLASVARDQRLQVVLLGYTFLTMPAWILVEFGVYGLVAGTAPDLAHAPNKYVGSLERTLITTCVLTGQFLLVPLVAAPRLVFEGAQVLGSQRTTVYLSEWLASTALAVAVGLWLRS